MQQPAKHAAQFALALVFALMSGCAVSKGTINSYFDNTYHVGSIRKIALFSIRNASRAPSEARAINIRLAQALTAKNPQIEIISPARSLELINDKGLASKWADFVDDFYTSGIANRPILEEVAAALGVDAVLQGDLVNLTQEDGSGTRRGVVRVTVCMSIVEATSARRVWEVSADGIQEDNTLFYDIAGSPAPPVAAALDLAIGKILENLPTL